MKVTIKGKPIGGGISTYPRLDICPNCKKGFEYIGRLETDVVLCYNCNTPRKTIFQSDETTNPKEYLEIRDEFLTNLRYGLSMNDMPEPMLEFDFNTMQETIDQQEETISSLEDENARLEAEIVSYKAAIDILQNEKAEFIDGLSDLESAIVKLIR